jgi:hypothetical protein
MDMLFPTIFADCNIPLLQAVYDVYMDCPDHKDPLLQYSKQHLKELVTKPAAFPFVRALLGLSSTYQALIFRYDIMPPIHEGCLLQFACHPYQIALRQHIIPLLASYDLAERFLNFLIDEREVDTDRLAAFQAVAPRELLLFYRDYCLTFSIFEPEGFAAASFTKAIEAVNVYWSPATHRTLNTPCHTIVTAILLCAERFLPNLPSELWREFIFPHFQVNDFLVQALKM